LSTLRRSHVAGENDEQNRYVTVLHIPPVDSPPTAVKLAIVQEYRERERNQETKKVGRPKLPKGHAKTQTLGMRIDDADLKLFTKAAKASEKNLSAWIRATLREAAQE
jgi:hypothetical protein